MGVFVNGSLYSGKGVTMSVRLWSRKRPAGGSSG